MMNKISRRTLSGWAGEVAGGVDGSDEYTVFLDDVAERGLVEACRERCLTLSATLNWIREDAGREGRYERAKQVKAEGMVHEVVGIADGDGDIGRDKLRIEGRMRVAGKWDVKRYGERVEGVMVVGLPSEAELNAQLAVLVGGNPGLLEALVAMRGDAGLLVTVENAGSAPDGAVTEDGV